MTYKVFKDRYFGDNEDVSDRIAKEFWDDFRYAFSGSLDKYIRETSRVMTASSAYEQGTREESGRGWKPGKIQYGLKSQEDMYDGSLVPPVRDSYGNPQETPDVSHGINLNELAKKLASRYVGTRS